MYALGTLKPLNVPLPFRVTNKQVGYTVAYPLPAPQGVTSGALISPNAKLSENVVRELLINAKTRGQTEKWDLPTWHLKSSGAQQPLTCQ